jgi:hypothetical protein
MEIEAAIAAYNNTDPEMLLPPEAARLLTIMFRRSGVCQRRLDDLAAEGFDRRTLPRLLRALANFPAQNWAQALVCTATAGRLEPHSRTACRYSRDKAEYKFQNNPLPQKLQIGKAKL